MRKILGLFVVRKGSDLFSILFVCFVVFIFYQLLTWGGVGRVMLIINILIFLAVGVMGYVIWMMLKDPTTRERFDSSRKAYFKGELKDQPEDNGNIQKQNNGEELKDSGKTIDS